MSHNAGAAPASSSSTLLLGEPSAKRSALSTTKEVAQTQSRAGTGGRPRSNAIVNGDMYDDDDDDAFVPPSFKNSGKLALASSSSDEDDTNATTTVLHFDGMDSPDAVLPPSFMEHCSLGDDGHDNEIDGGGDDDDDEARMAQKMKRRKKKRRNTTLFVPPPEPPVADALTRRRVGGMRKGM